MHIDQGDREDPVPLKMKIYRLNAPVYNDLIAGLAGDVFRISEDGYGPGILIGQIEAKSTGYMILSIPYDEGFTVYVDGTKTDTYPAMGMMTAIPLKTGLHRVELRYRPPGLIGGAIVTFVSLLLFALFYKYLMDDAAM